ncbi:MAG: hypothetical protein H7841_02900 [Magnetospirillum sp. WYHS-4]
MDANEKVQDMIVITGHLADLLERENAALKAHRPGEVKAMLEEKTKLARAYEVGIKGLRDAPSSLAGADEDLRERLRLLARRMEELMAENARLLKMAITVGRRVMESFAMAVKSVDTGAGTYAASGSIAMRKSGRRSAPRGPAVTINQSL